MHPPDALVLGIGNPILTDDGIGPRLVSDLLEQFRRPGVDYRTAAVGGLDILEMMEGYRVAAFVDAIRTGRAPPGTLHTFTTGDFQETEHLSNLHDIGFLSAFRLGRTLGLRVPERVTILGIEVLDERQVGEELTPPMAGQYERILGQVRSLLDEFLEETGHFRPSPRHDGALAGP